MLSTWSYWHGPRPAVIDLCIETIARHNPGFRLLSQNDVVSLGGADIVNMTKGRSPFLQSDLIRLWLLKEFGGQWIDADCIALARLDMVDHLNEFELVGYTNGSASHFSNNILAARKGGELITKAFNNCSRLITNTPSHQQIPYGHTGQLILGNLYRDNADQMRRFHRWRYNLIHYTQVREFFRITSDGQHARRNSWNPAARTYHLTNKAVARLRTRTREEILSGRSFVSFLIRRSLGRVRPLRAQAILSRLPRDTRLVGAEIGVLKGDNAITLLQQRPQLTLYMIDAWQDHPADSSYKRSKDANAFRSKRFWELAKRLVERRAAFAGERARIIKDFSVRGMAQIPDASLDFGFIDADHSYEGCKPDLETLWPKIKPGGFASGHDYNHSRERSGQWGVKKAVDEFAGRIELKVVAGQDLTWFIHKAGP